MKSKKFDIKDIPRKWQEIVFLSLNPDLYKEIKESATLEGAQDIVQERALGSFLRIAVPLWVKEISKKDLDYVMKRKEEIATIVGSMGDSLLYPDPKNEKGRVEDIFNSFAEGIAILATLAHGGVEMYGVKFDYQMPKHW